MRLPVRDDLRDRTPYGAPQLDVPVRLNTNENPYPPPPAIVDDLAAAVRAAGPTLNRYPDREAVALRADLAGYLGQDVDVEQVWAANGSNEVLQQVLQTFGGPGRTALGFEPSYAMHANIAAATATGWVAGHRDADFGLRASGAVLQVRSDEPDIVFLTSPNNPTGAALPLEVVRAVCEVAQGIVIVDEAYAEFARPGTPSALTLLPEFERLVVTRTMSKAFAMAGTRLGYLVAAPAVVDALRLVRLPYHLSTLTQAAARVALAHTGPLLSTVEAIRSERDQLVATLARTGCAVVASDANFVLFGGFPDAAAVWRGLLARGVLVRDVGLPGWLRVTVGLPSEVAAFVTALGEVLR
ncbi:MAG: histidinol-phosphate transaminase [Pseudonocardiales bacterium]